MRHEPSANRPRPLDELIGSVIRGKWRVDTVLGTGGMATVFAATHKGNGRRVALKIMHPSFADDQASRERFLREAYLGNKVPHRGRVEVFDDDVTDDGLPFLIMDLLEGETIAQVQRRIGKRLPLELALDLAEQLLDVLASCHAQAVLHLDLKPANVLVSPDGVVKLLDFGVAQLRDGDDDDGRSGLALGTPSFMSPEQARGLTDQLDGRADLFSVGAMLYFMLSGTRLYKGLATEDALDLAASRPPPSVAGVAPDLPPPVIALVDRALAFQRDARFQSAIEMRNAVLELARVLRETPKPRRTVPPAYGSSPPMKSAPPSRPSAPPPTFSGDLSRSPLPHILINILQRELTGTLVLTTSARRVLRVFFDAGVAIKLDGDAPREVTPFAVRIATLGALAPSTTYAFHVGHDALPGEKSFRADPLATIFRTIVAWKDVPRKVESLKRLGDRPLALHPAAALPRFGLTTSEVAMLSWTLDERLSYPEANLAADDPDTLRDVIYALSLMRHIDLGPAHWPFGVAAPPPSSSKHSVSIRSAPQSVDEDRLSKPPDLR